MAIMGTARFKQSDDIEKSGCDLFGHDDRVMHELSGYLWRSTSQYPNCANDVALVHFAQHYLNFVPCFAFGVSHKKIDSPSSSLYLLFL